jgi:1-acyl-sn-glycerol-3-phosphate acyltransferase
MHYSNGNRYIFRGIFRLFIFVNILLIMVILAEWISFFSHLNGTNGTRRKAQLVQWGCRKILNLLKFKVGCTVLEEKKERGTPSFFPSIAESKWSLDQPRLVVANHVSYFDVVVLGSLIPGVFLAKSEVGHWPLLGRLGKAIGGLFVKRDSLSLRVRALHQIKNALCEKSVVVFPEGTTSSRYTPLSAEWKPGSFWAAQACSHPCVHLASIVYQHQEEVSWIGEEAFFPHLWMLLQMPPTQVNVMLLPFKMAEEEESIGFSQAKKWQSSFVRRQSHIALEKLTKVCLFNSSQVPKRSQTFPLVSSSLWAGRMTGTATSDFDPEIIVL